MSKATEYILKPREEEEIIQAIQAAELRTSGEIRVHIEKEAQGDVYERALEVFHLLKMDQTKLSNGVLIYLAVADKAFAICGDKGIHDNIPDDFWDTTKNLMQSHFKAGNFKQGLIEGIHKSGEQLAKFFPWKKNDENELSNAISKG